MQLYQYFSELEIPFLDTAQPACRQAGAAVEFPDTGKFTSERPSERRSSLIIVAGPTVNEERNENEVMCQKWNF